MPPELIIRRVVPEDARALTDYMIRLVGEEHNNIVLDPGQWTMSEAEERAYLQKAAADADQYFIVAELAGEIVGSGTICREARPTMRHAASLGMSVDAAHRRRGIGRALLQALVDWAREQGLRRVALQVMTRNAAGIALYKKMGFVEEGCHRMALFKQGVWVDEYTMALIMEERKGGGCREPGAAGALKRGENPHYHAGLGGGDEKVHGVFRS
jgi:RimJ/RimL family protein N-acetyltransferase